MSTLPGYEVRTYGKADRVPAEAEAMFARQLSDSRGSPAPWSFILVCAETPDGHVLGGVHLDCGPIGGTGPIAGERLAYLERTLVAEPYRRQGLATALLRKALEEAAEAGCLYVRCSNDWANEAERRLFLRCGFALVDLNGEEEAERCYMAVRPLSDYRTSQ